MLEEKEGKKNYEILLVKMCVELRIFVPLSSPNRMYADMEGLLHPVSIFRDKLNILISYLRNADPSKEFKEFIALKEL